MRYICIFIVLVFSLQSTVLADSLDEVQVRVQKVQETPAVGVPNAPINMDQKWFVGEILATIFNPTGKIQGLFIEAFTSILWSTFNNNIPKWNGQIFLLGTLWDVSGNIGIATKTPTTRLDVNGVGTFKGINSWSKLSISPSGNAMIAQGVWSNYWFFAVKDVNGNRGAYFWAGNGWNRVNLYLDSADTLAITWGNVGIGTLSPSAALEVTGNIISTNNPTQPNHVATKYYVDTQLNGVKNDTKTYIDTQISNINFWFDNPQFFEADAAGAFVSLPHTDVYNGYTFSKPDTVSINNVSACFLTTNIVLPGYQDNNLGSGGCDLQRNNTTSWTLRAVAKNQKRMYVKCIAMCF